MSSISHSPTTQINIHHFSGVAVAEGIYLYEPKFEVNQKLDFPPEKAKKKSTPDGLQQADRSVLCPAVSRGYDADWASRP
jgi:hypothetical protein